MSRNRRRRKAKSFPNFDEMQPVDPDEFSTAFNFAMNAGSGNAIIDDPTKKRHKPSRR